ncbi:MAG: acyltransferase [Betaproteobacteria bacterium]|nr:MAG: acyltransferase [Betaproteobacteria bacterium]
MLPLFRSIGRAIKLRPVPGCLTNLWLSIRWNAAVSPRARVSRPWLLRLGRGAQLGACTIECSGKGVDIGVDAYVHDDVLIDCQLGSIEIGARTTINSFSALYGAGGIRIGAGCLIATSTVIVASEHRFDLPGIPIQQQGSITAGIDIGDDVWLAAGVRVLDGIAIGQGAVVGANAVVNRTIPAFAVAAGIPARVIKMRPGFDGQKG